MTKYRKCPTLPKLTLRTLNYKLTDGCLQVAVRNVVLTIEVKRKKWHAQWPNVSIGGVFGTYAYPILCRACRDVHGLGRDSRRLGLEILNVSSRTKSSTSQSRLGALCLGSVGLVSINIMA